MVEANFDGGRVTSDAGVLLFRELDEDVGITKRLADCFTDHRNPDRIEHTVRQLVSQRLMALVAGYEDLNDHDTLRDDVVFALAAGKEDLTGESRERERDQGHALAASSTLNRLELTPPEADETHRYKKIVYAAEAMDRLLVEAFLEAHDEPPCQIVLDLDATDDPLHGHQEGRFFHGYYRCYCYLPLYIFCGGFPLCARQRTSGIDGAAGSKDEVIRIVNQIRERWPRVHIVLRADSGFAREELMAWCEQNSVDFVFGLARNSRLVNKLRHEFERLEQRPELERLFRDFRYRTLDSWSRTRRVVGKAEHTGDKENPRFVVTSLRKKDVEARELYEKLYCARGDMENRIKEQQLAMFADRTSTHTMRANQLRLYFSTFAYLLVHLFRRTALAGTELARAQCDTIRLRLIKLGAVIRVSVRRVYFALSSVYPAQSLFRRALNNLQRPAPT
jgi:hypothetical protein